MKDDEEDEGGWFLREAVYVSRHGGTIQDLRGRACR